MERKSVTNITKVILETYNIGLFALVWMVFYNHYSFQTFYLWGCVVSIALYAIIYNWFGNIYKAFRIASFRIVETTFAQLISFGLADLFLYVECCLSYNGYVSIWRGVAILCMQTLGSFLIITCAKQYFIRHIPPKQTLLIYGADCTSEEVETFTNKLMNKYIHLFVEKMRISEDAPLEQIEKLIDEAETILMYEVSGMSKQSILQYSINRRKAVYLSPSLLDLMIQGCTARHLIDTPLIKYDYPCEKRFKDIPKRILDIVFSLLMLIAATPVMLMVAIAIKIEDGGKVFYTQKRYTLNEKIFNMIKFRSMVMDAEKDGFVPCTNEDWRITRVGKFIRKTRIDELPQIFNILAGDMSIVGPRPERVEHVEKYTEEMPEFSYRLRVKGGLTGYAQIYGRYNTSPYDKLRLDLMYIEKRSLILDIKIVMLTIKTIFSKESSEGFSEERSRNIRLAYEMSRHMIEEGMEQKVI